MRFLLGMISILGTVAYGITLSNLWDSNLVDAPHFRAALLGFLVGSGVWVALGKRLSFFSVFEHELTHLIFGLMMFQRPRSFYASEKRGHVTSDGGNFIDNLAPYYFPTFSYMLLGVYPLLKAEVYGYFFPILGFVTGYHLVSNVAEFSFSESDIRRSGRLFSTVFCIFAAIVAFGFVMAFIIGGYKGGLEFLGAGWHEARDVVASGAGLARRLIALVLHNAG
jgi:hypothetical protein